MKRTLTKAIIILTLGAAASCDMQERDADAELITINSDPAYFMSNGSAFIDLSARVVAPGKVTFEVTGPTSNGQLTDLGKGLLQYTPLLGRARNDSFSFTVLSGKNILATKDINIVTSSDSTQLPCAIYTRNDFAYGASSQITIDVLANDYICVESVVVSVEGNVAPSFGKAQASNNKIVYTPGPAFTEGDKFIYKVSASDPSIAAAYGIVYVSGRAACSIELQDDALNLNTVMTSKTSFDIPVLSNDAICLGSVKGYSIEVTPKYGRAEFVGNLVKYVSPDTIRNNPFTDEFIYKVCVDAVCKTAKVMIKATDAPPCVVTANDDMMDLSQNSIPVMYLDVLNNDETCDGVTLFKIKKAALHGTAVISADKKTIEYTRGPGNHATDTIEYEICDMNACSIATVTIKLTP